MLSWNGPAAGLEELRARWRELSSVPARLVRLVALADLRHDNDDQVLATIGKAVLGQPFDGSFYKP